MAQCNLTLNYFESPRHGLESPLILDPKQRKRFLPSLFGRYFMRGESIVYAWMRELSDEYKGGFWNYYRLSNGGFYMSPEMHPSSLIICQNDFRGTMSTDAVGIVCTLFALRYLSYDRGVQLERDLLTKNFFSLLRFVSFHREDQAIRSVIDC